MGLHGHGGARDDAFGDAGGAARRDEGRGGARARGAREGDRRRAGRRLHDRGVRPGRSHGRGAPSHRDLGRPGEEDPHGPQPQRPGCGGRAPARQGPAARPGGRAGRARKGARGFRQGARPRAPRGAHAPAARHAELGGRVGDGPRRDAPRPDREPRGRISAERPLSARLGRRVRRAASASRVRSTTCSARRWRAARTRRRSSPRSRS